MKILLSRRDGVVSIFYYNTDSGECKGVKQQMLHFALDKCGKLWYTINGSGRSERIETSRKGWSIFLHRLLHFATINQENERGRTAIAAEKGERPRFLVSHVRQAVETAAAYAREQDVPLTVERLAAELHMDAAEFCRLVKEKGRESWRTVMRDAYEPVSYTHLDVYKRQAHRLSAEAGRRQRL